MAGWIFKFLAGLFETILLFPLFGFKPEHMEMVLEKRPRRFITVVILKNVIIGLANSIMIITICSRFVVEYEGNYWLYFSLGVLWSLFILSDKQAFNGVFFWPSTVNFILMWFGFGWISILVIGLLTFFISIAYYYGRIGALQQYYNSYDKNI
jgi:hypothetical protein